MPARVLQPLTSQLTCGPKGNFTCMSSQLVLTGVLPGTATSAGTIDGVMTSVGLTISGVGYSFPFTFAAAPAQGSGVQCGGANQPFCPVPVVAGQSVSVTVTISFQ